MPRHLTPRTTLTVGLAVLTAAALASAPRPAVALAVGQPAAGPAGPAATSQAGSSRPVLLINGDRLSVRAVSGGVLAAVLLPGAREPGGLLSLKLAGAAYEIPADAAPYLGRGLDPGLFRLSLLERIERGGRLPVRISFAGRLPRLPGVTITRAGPGTAAGYLTAASAGAFGAALDRQFRADHARASYGADGLFGGGVSIALAGTAAATAPKAVRPGFQMHTLTVAATDRSGGLDTGDTVWVFNADNPAKFGDPIEDTNSFDHGTTRFSVPAGHYWALADFTVATGTTFSDHLDVLPQFTVTRNATVHVAERAAGSDITTTTPRPSEPLMVTAELIRTSPHGGLNSFTWSGLGASLWISPTTRRPTVGGLLFYPSEQLVSPARAAGIPYAYNADYSGPAGVIPADQHHVLRPASLADVSELYYQDVRTEGVFSDFGSFVPQLQGLLFALDVPLRLPGRQVQYFSAGRGLFWQSAYSEFAPLTSFPWGGQSDGNLRPLRPGPQTVSWNRYPLHPQPPASPGGVIARVLPQIPAAIRTGNTLNLAMTPFSDNSPGHLGAGFTSGPGATATGSYRVDQNGVRIAHGRITNGNAFNGIPAIRLSPKPSRLSFTLDAARTGRFPLSTSSQTVWTWRSSRQPHAVLPPAWFCGVGLIRGQFRLLRGCAAQPLLTLGYQVRDESLTGSVPPGRQVIALHAGHIEPAAAAAITGAGAQVSLNDGQSWRHVPVTALGGGNFRIAFGAPAGVDVTLRVTASDAAGGSVRETILRAYGVRPARSAAVRPAAVGTGTPGPASVRPELRPACPVARPRQERCFVLYQPVAPGSRGMGGQAARPLGWGARALEAAYRLPAGRHSHQTVAVSIAYNTPHLAHFLAVYRKQYGLPPCTVASGCFRQVNQRGRARPLPPSGVGSGWDLEVTLDVSMISAACPYCKIVVVEGNSADVSDLARTDDTAARLGARVVSNSYGIRESGFALQYAGAYRHRGHTIVASAGDFGFTAANFPADLSAVTAVGGTELRRAHNRRGWSETVWNSQAEFGAGGSGCSAYVPKPAWQHDRHCPGRTVADVSAVADHVAIYNPTYGGWISVAGTSIAAPLIAGIYGLAGNAARIGPGYLYAHARSLFDVTRGNNELFATPAQACGDDYLCMAKRGYDAPTGLGTPDGTGAF